MLASRLGTGTFNIQKPQVWHLELIQHKDREVWDALKAAAHNLHISCLFSVAESGSNTSEPQDLLVHLEGKHVHQTLRLGLLECMLF